MDVNAVGGAAEKKGLIRIICPYLSNFFIGAPLFWK